MATNLYNEHIIFPLCILSMNDNTKMLIKPMIYYALVNIAKHNNLSLNSKTLNDRISEIAKDKNVKLKFIDKFKNFKLIKLLYKKVKDYKIEFEDINGNDARVLMKISVLYDFKYYSKLSDKEFRVLCAIYSCLGTNEVRIIYNDQIRYRAFGFKSRNAYYKIRAERNKNVSIPEMSDKVLKRIIEKLIQRGFFDRQRDGRRYYYSKVLRGRNLLNYVFKRYSYNRIHREISKTKENEFKKMKQIFEKQIENGKISELEYLENKITEEME